MKELIQCCIRKGCLIDSELLNLLKDSSPLISENLIETFLAVQNKKILTKNLFLTNLNKILRILTELKINSTAEKKSALEDFINNFSSTSPKSTIIPDDIKTNLQNTINIIKSYNIQSRKVTVDDFVKYFKARFLELKNILQERPELINLTSINKISNQRQNVSIIGIIYNIRTTKNKNIIIEMEDMTGRISVLVHNSKEDLMKKAKDLVLDEIVGIRCNGNSEILFANEIIAPDIFVEKVEGRGEGYAAFIADLHVGSMNFLENGFNKFIKWLNGELGDEHQREIGKKVRYLFIVGDLVDGVGIYPGQENELAILDIRDQYLKVTELLSKIREDMVIIICPGNHDAVRIAEPQPQLEIEYAKELYKLKNAFFVSNPSFINIPGNGRGTNILLYHGYSYHYYANNVDSLRFNGGSKKPEIIMSFLLKKRHLAPSHSSTLYFPQEFDPLVINMVPDVFVSAHVHKSAAIYYNNILAISCSCWQSKTAFQEKMGNEPDFCKVPLLNLRNNRINMLDFSE